MILHLNLASVFWLSSFRFFNIRPKIVFMRNYAPSLLTTSISSRKRLKSKTALVYTLVELWAWNEKEDRLKDRSRSPWDDVLRRPSHADKRNALRRTMIEQEMIDAFGRKLEPATINSLLKFMGSIAP